MNIANRLTLDSTNAISAMLEAQKAVVNKDLYQIGFCNGLECALAILQNREPTYYVTESRYEDLENEAEREQKPESGRTLYSGVRRR